MTRTRLLALAAGLVLLAGGASVALRASGSATPGCPKVEDLRNPIIDFKQEPRSYVHVTLTNPNDCYGFLDEPVEITLFGARGRRLVSYYGDGAPQEIGVCCTVTLPPHGTWTIRLGTERNNAAGLDRLKICDVYVEALKHKGYAVWRRMPDGGAITGRGSMPPGFDPDAFPPLPDDPTWRDPCNTPPPSPS